MSEFDAALAETAPAEARVAQARRERDQARQTVKHLESRNEELERMLDLLNAVDALSPKPPKWLTPKRTPSTHHATVTTILSDMHFDEVVNPAEMGGVNAYNRDIATLRLRRYFEGVIKMSRSYMSGVTYDGLVLMLGGDSITGEIHDELARSNADSIPGTLLYWSELLAAGVDMLADEFGKVAVFAVPGNHGRMDRKTPAKQMARRSFDWLLANMVAREFARDNRVTCTIGEAFDSRFDVYTHSYLLHHGLVGGGGAGSGIGGIWPPIMRDDARRRNMHQSVGQPYDTAVLGHWHTLTWGPGSRFIINGSPKGLDEWARSKGFGYEPPQQAMWLTTPERGITLQCAVQCADRKREGW